MNLQLQNKLQTSQKTFQEWKEIPFEERQKLLKKLSKILLERNQEFAEIITNEMNKPISQSISEVEKCVLMIHYYANAKNILIPEKIETEFRLSEVNYVPKGVILGVMPWNFPFWQVLRFAIPAILAGNTVVLKHASICFGSGNAIQDLFLEAGFPNGVFTNLEIGHQEVEEVLKNPIIRGVSLTGSEKAGSSVASIAGKYIKKSLLELGGSDAFIVLEDADTDQAAKVGALARLQNCGQTCIAAKRFIIHEKIVQEFLPKFISEFQKYQPQDKMDKNTILSGMSRPDLADELENQYQKALENGAEVLLPLQRISENEFIPGLILLQPGNPILKEEVFGPLGLVLFAKDDKKALELANDIPFGLANSVWTKSETRQNYFIENLVSGTVSINKMTSSDPRLPFGGVKNSGFGSELSLLALKEFVDIKTIVGK